MAMFLELNKPQPLVLFELVKGMITGDKPDLGEPQLVEQESGAPTARGAR
jgi:hypothetical protein